MDTKLNILIVDDDRPSVALLRDALSVRTDVNDCTVAYSLQEASEKIRDSAPDLIFLDMEFPDASGLNWFESVSLPDSTRVVFYTAYRRYIHDAMSAHVFDFLLKPFDSEDLDAIFRHFHNIGTTDNLPAKPQRFSALSHQRPRTLSITTVINDKMIVSADEILYFRYDSERKLWECILTSSQRFMLKRQSTAETLLNFCPDFIRTHKQYIININYLINISSDSCTLLSPTEDEIEIRISKSYRRALLDQFYDI